MGSVRKASAWLGLVDGYDDNADDNRYYDDDYTEEPETGRGRVRGIDSARAGAGAAGGSAELWKTDPRIQVAAEAAVEQGRRIATITPDGFRDARGIGEHFRAGVPVIVNLTAMDAADAKRVVDFAAGLTFGLRGSIERVATRVFLLTPADYRIVSGESTGRASGGFFNQS
ncbi:cell division protein SepF [Streptomyces sp. NPDC060194]|uniref:cell division protein SepF n=1 Tax=Streptomyces sp. NPDC060194 TaxID=3347069 RepID=UPI003656F700